MQPHPPRRRSLRLVERAESEQEERGATVDEEPANDDENPPDVQPQHHFVGRRFPPEVDRYSVGSLKNRLNRCVYCQAYRFNAEALNCCQNGKVDLQPLHPYPDQLIPLFSLNNTVSRNFMENIRKYNSAMAFASFGAKMVSFHGNGPYCFKIHGQIYHRAGSLHPQDDQSPVYSQLYIIEGDQAVEARLNNRQNSECLPDVMRLLTVTLNEVNPYAAAYKHMQQVEAEQIAQATANNTVAPTVTMVIKRGHDRRRYNEPTHDEIAAVFVGRDGEPPEGRDIMVHPRNEAPTNLSHMSSNTDPMVYPLFFPHGDMGWCRGILHDAARRTRTNNTVTPMQFYSYRFAEREQFSPLFHGGKLFQQIIVDAYVRVEAHRLNYIRTNQANFRVEQYQGLMDHLHSQAEQQEKTPGKIVILCCSYRTS
jgi:hypothetical protein